MKLRACAVFFIIVLLFSGCGAFSFSLPPQGMDPYHGEEPPREAERPQGGGIEKPTYKPRDPSFYDDLDREEEEAEEGVERYIPSDGLSPQELVEVFFQQQYEAYTSLRYIDISELLDFRQVMAVQMEIWYEMLIQRRRLLDEYDLCYVNTQSYPYTIEFLDESEIEDGRVEDWYRRNPDLDFTMIHFTITGEEGVAYPPMMAVNAQHTMWIRQVDGEWKIIFHYYPGSPRKYRMDVMERQSEEEMLAALEEEFAVQEDSRTGARTAGRPYDGGLAAEYALRFAENPNPKFYRIRDGMGNCSNFTSQCIWYGFTKGEEKSPTPSYGRMTSAWYAGEGGGSPAWENVEHFWNWAVAGRDMQVQQLERLQDLQAGDLIQTRVIRGEWDSEEEDGEEEEPGRFHHSLLVVDAETMLLAQNSPCNFIYYCDILNVDIRMLRPLSLIG